MNDILTKIIADRRTEVEARRIPVTELKAKYRDRTDFRPFRQALCRTMTESSAAAIAAVIAELKRGSPAKGLFAPLLDPISTAKEYEIGGAACLSVLTEPRYFFGSFDDLISARNSCELPILQKDFIITEYQIYEAALHADAVLLIARCLEPSQLADLHGLATELKLDVLVEVFDEEDIDKIELSQGSQHFPLIGINHRNLRTMDIDLDRSRRLFSRFSPDQTVVAASGIQNRHDIDTLMREGIRSFLIGESLSTHPNRMDFLRELVEGGQHVD